MTSFRSLFKLLFINFLLTTAFPTFVFASTNIDPHSVSGNWITIDGKTKKSSSIIHIEKKGLFYTGKIIKTFPVPGDKTSTICMKCKGDEHNKPILGLEIIQHMVCNGGACRDGLITDPRDGKVYHAEMKLIKGGYYLKVRGYVGIPLFGKTVVWQRAISAPYN